LTADVRLIAATNKNLEERVKAGTFREDLFSGCAWWKFNCRVARRAGDIPLLAQKFLREFAHENGKPLNDFTADALEWLMQLFVAGQRARVAHGHRTRGGVVPRGKKSRRAICRRQCGWAGHPAAWRHHWREMI